MRNKSLPLYQNVEILDIAAEGKSVAKHENLVIFVSGAVPGDIVDIQITKKKSNFREGRAVQIQKQSDKRVEPVCEHFGVCGGCVWQNLHYKHQLYYKQKQVVDSLERIAKINLQEQQILSPILPAQNEYHYRNKLEYTFSNLRWQTRNEFEDRETRHDLNGLGFHVPKMFDKVVDINECHLQREPSNSIRREVKKFTIENNYSYFNIRNHSGFLRNLIIRTSSTGDVMIIISFYYEDVEKREALLNHIANQFPEITALLYVINSKANDTFLDLDIKTYKGSGFIYEQMEELKFKISPKSFFQTNSEQAYNLYKVVREYAQLAGNEVVYDLYTGTGTIANFVANKASKVIGIEYVEEAIKDAVINSEINNIKNTQFFAGDLKNVLTRQFIETHGKPDVIITDPPRAGMLESVVRTMMFAEPKRIVYVSCNPATQARDLEILQEKYQVTRIQPVDMFPHTQHVENVVLLERLQIY